MPDDELVAALRVIQARGAIGMPIADAVAHADRFVAQLPAGPASVVDLGSGGGLPGLVIAVRRPDLRVTLVERRHTRADLLRRAVQSLQLGDRVSVVADDVATVAGIAPRSFDIVTARSFAAPPVTARWAGELLRDGGLLLVSEPPVDDPERWPAALLEECGLAEFHREQGFRVFTRC